ncbi:MAG: aldose 1-epimerase family protein [Nocardioidaceae bacterium]
MSSPSGHAVHLSAGGYEAVVVEVGAGLRSLTRGGLDVVAGYGPEEMATGGRGQLLLPWPNRIRDGRYAFGGREHQLPLSEPARRNASHGLTRWVNWSLLDHDASSAIWGYTLHPQPGYPFLLELTVGYQVTPDGLTVDVTATNLGDDAALYGHGAHPYLTVGRRIDECELLLPATARCEVDDRKLPGPAADVRGTAFDFTRSRVIGTTIIDHPFTGVLADEDGTTQSILRDPDTGRTAMLWADAAYPWLQVFSGDDLATGARGSLAVEPMTCPPDAFNSGVDLVVLQPGESDTGRFGIR